MLPERRTVINDRSINWTLVPHPSPGWVAVAHPELPPEDALARLVAELPHICRLDEPDPAAAWRERMTMLAGVGERLTERRFDAKARVSGSACCTPAPREQRVEHAHVDETRPAVVGGAGYFAGQRQRRPAAPAAAVTPVR
ncbi:aminopeptidase [Streptomyces griseorubiginosus]|uniref:aminopeptidase n=1 Tax=Streptomyces griseorubiginosus TaxID=67304 RepID=UPI0036E936A9